MQMNFDVLIWMTVGIALLSSEAFTGSFHLLFVGLSALMTSAVASMGLSSSVGQSILFAVLSFASVFLLRRRLIDRARGFEDDPDKRAQLSAPLPVGGEGTIQFKGAAWTAVNSSGRDLATGETVRVIRIEGIKLIIEPLEQNATEKSWESGLQGEKT